MNPVIKNIRQRRSIRRYTQKPIPKNLIEEIIGSGRYAPSSHNSQPWRFVVITSKSKIKELSDHIKKWFRLRSQLGNIVGLFNKKIKQELGAAKQRVITEQDLFFYDAPLLILVCAKPGRFSNVNCACAAQNMMLAARSLGIGSCWVGFADMVINKDRALMDELGVPKECKVFVHLIFGYPVKFPEKAFSRKDEAGIVKWIK